MCARRWCHDPSNIHQQTCAESITLTPKAEDFGSGETTATPHPICPPMLGRVDKKLQPEACSGEVEEALEREDGLIVAGSDAALLFELAEHALDAVPVFISPIVGMYRCLAVRAWRDDRQNAAHGQVFAEPVAVITLVGEQRLGFRQWQRRQVIGRIIIRSLPAGQYEPDRQSMIVAAGVDFARKAAA